MNRVTIDLSALQHNIRTIDGWLAERGASWTLVTKVLCGHLDTLDALQRLGVKSMADSRLTNLKAIRSVTDDFEAWYLRPPHLTAVADIVELADVSLTSEIRAIEALDAEARRRDTIHRTVVMLELGDLREGVLPGSLIDFCARAFDFDNVEVIGIGANLGCLSGVVPSVDQLDQLVLYHELLELKFSRRLPLISAGASILLPMMLDGEVPAAVNHYRIGEAVFLGTDLVHGGTLDGLRDDAITLEVEVVEVREKGLVPVGETGSMTPFETFDDVELQPGQRGYRAVITVGQLDTEVRGLTPLDPRYQLTGASSDVAVVNVGDNPAGLTVGDTISFRPSYGSLVRLMLSPYVDKFVGPSIDEYRRSISAEDRIEVPPVIDEH
ncbi:MAG: alanine racemase [Holophagae bacterium]|jgi:predicted amino acid racemase